MSQFLPDQGNKKPDEKGPESYLTSEERKALQRALSFPEDLPPRFKSWIVEHVVTNIQDLPVSQLSGFRQIDQVEVSSATVTAFQSTSSGSYTNLATVGPQLTGLRSGRYIVQHGALLVNTGGVSGFKAFQSVSVNGAAAVDTDSCSQNVGANGDQTASVSTALVKDLTAAENSIVCKYRIGISGTCFASNRWLIAQRIGPVPES